MLSVRLEETETLISPDHGSLPLLVQLKSFLTVINLPLPKISKPRWYDLRLSHNRLTRDLMETTLLNGWFS